MNRKEIDFLITWKSKEKHKPLIINGARQVGKTWLMKSFGKEYFKQVAYINFESSRAMESVFDSGYNIDKILLAIQIETGIIPDKDTLIIFDEIQLVPKAITSLKYFYESEKHYSIVCAGSLLGITLGNKAAFPVGKVEILDLYPLTFEEFLEACGHVKLLQLIQNKEWDLIKSFNTQFQDFLKQYLYVGGMPEVVAHYSIHQNFKQVRLLQKNILRSYELDFSKHAPSSIVPRIRLVWNSIVSQLAKENKKFIYNALRSGARAKDYELALSWLVDAGLIYKVHNISTPQIPLKAYEDFDAFKLFGLDVGLMGAMADVDSKILLKEYSILEEYKGALAEQYVLQQLIAQNKSKLYYWSPPSLQSEIDFITEINGAIVPIEVKANENLQAKSLKVFYQKYQPTKSFRISMADYKEDKWLINLPLYAVSEIYTICNNSI